MKQMAAHCEFPPILLLLVVAAGRLGKLTEACLGGGARGANISDQVGSTSG